MAIKKEELKKLWQYVSENYEEALADAIDEFEFDASQMSRIDTMTDENIIGVADELMYMLVNGVFGCDFDMTREVLLYTLGFDEQLVGELLAW